MLIHSLTPPHSRPDAAAWSRSAGLVPTHRYPRRCDSNRTFCAAVRSPVRSGRRDLIANRRALVGVPLSPARLGLRRSDFRWTSAGGALRAGDASSVFSSPLAIGGPSATNAGSLGDRAYASLLPSGSKCAVRLLCQKPKHCRWDHIVRVAGHCGHQKPSRPQGRRLSRQQAREIRCRTNPVLPSGC